MGLNAVSKSRKELESQLVEVALEVPSGKLVYSDWLGDMFRIDKDFDVNTFAGRRMTTVEYGKAGLFHGCVGNSCPSIYQDGQKFYIGLASSEKSKNSGIIPGKEVGSIITDLWWYSLADYDEYVKRGGSPDHEFISVTPGRYVLKHRLNASSSDPKPALYATIELSSDPVKEWVLPEEEIESALTKILPAEHRKSYFSVKLDYLEDQTKKYGDESRYSFKGYVVSLYPEKGFGMLKITDDEFQKQEPQQIMDRLIHELNHGWGAHREEDLSLKKDGKIYKSTMNKIMAILVDEDTKPKKSKKKLTMDQIAKKALKGKDVSKHFGKTTVHKGIKTKAVRKKKKVVKKEVVKKGKK